MKVIKKNDAEKGTDCEVCKTIEYSFGDKDIDLGVATITGRFPESGYGMNTICKELVYVLEGSGSLFIEGREVTFSEGDSILIDKNEKYCWKSDYCKISMACTPAWSREQHKMIQ